MWKGLALGTALLGMLAASDVAVAQQQQRDPATWFGDKPLTVAVQAQLGISVFLPFSWEYRLPK